MVSLGKLWQSFTKNTRRDSGASVGGITIPGPCFDECNQASVIAQNDGEDQSVICSTNSSFIVALQYCKQCISLEASSSNSTSSNVTSTDVQEYFNQFLDMCPQNSTTVQSMLSEVSMLESSLSALGWTATSTAAPTNEITTTTNPPASVVTVYATGANLIHNSTSSNDHSHVKTIVPAVLAPVVCVIIIITITIIFIRRRRRVKEIQTKTTSASGEHEEKPQLHSDEFRPELDASTEITPNLIKQKAVVPEGIAELPAREEVGSELDTERSHAGV